MVEAFVILGSIIVVLLAAGLIVAAKDVGRKGQPSAAGRSSSQARQDAAHPSPQTGYLFLSQPWS